MKKILVVFSLLLIFACKSYGQDSPIAAADAKDNIGRALQVKGKVAAVFTSKNGNTFINFDNKSPDQTFTAAIMKDVSLDISKITVGCILTVYGEIKDYKGKPEIVLTSQEQIISVEPSAEK